jgi:hypothetical protein
MLFGLRGPKATEGYLPFSVTRNPSWVHEELRSEGRLWAAMTILA